MIDFENFNAPNSAFDNESTNLPEKLYNQIWIIYRKKIDKYIFFIKTRWIITSLLLLTYIYRLAVYGGFYVVSYIMGLYLLHLSVQFFTPLGLPDIEDEIEDTVFNELPTTSGESNINQKEDDFKPLIRSVSEFKFWQQVTLAIFFAVCCTFTRFFDLPVFWPFLLIYFIFLCLATLHKLIKHMKKFDYGFFHSKNKKNYNGN